MPSAPPCFLLPAPALPPRRRRLVAPRASPRASADPQYLDACEPAVPLAPPPRAARLETDSPSPPPLYAAPPPPPPGGGAGAAGRPGGDRDDHDDLPPDLRAALLHGSLTADALARYRAARRSPLLALLMRVPSFRSRALADPAFLFKLAAQELIGNGTALASEIAVRGGDVVHELEYVASDLIVGTVVEAAFVWLLAPTLALPRRPAGWARFVGALPAHVFQPSTAVQQFSAVQRGASFLYAGAQYAAIGFAAGIVGTAITYGLIEARKRLDRSYQPERPLPAVLPNSLAWGAFMALSSNPRFQAVEGLEMGVAKLFGAGRATNSGIVVLRFLNNYWGGVQFVQFFRFLGLHAVAEQGEHDGS